MRILVATLRYPPYVAGGYEILTRDAVIGLREHGHEVWVISGRGRRLEQEPQHFPWYEPALPEEGEASNLFELSQDAPTLERLRLHFLRFSNLQATRRALRETRAEVLLFFNLGLVSLAPVLAARISGVPTVGVVTDPWPVNHWIREWRSGADSARKDQKLVLLERLWRTYRDAVALGPLLVSSDYLREELAREGIDRGTLDLLRLPLSPEMLPPDPYAGAPRRADGEPLRVACASMLWEGKGVHVLLEAAALAVEGGVQLELTLAGTGAGEYVERLHRLADDSRLAGRVHWAGLLDRAGTARLIHAAHVLVLPSTWGEPFPMATLEAMGQGVPPVASDAGGTPEQFEDGVEGLSVPAGDARALAGALAELAADEERRQALGRAARARVLRDYTMDAFLEGLESELDRFAGLTAQ